MSLEGNTQLLERASELLEEVTGTMWERIIQRDLDTQDYEALRYHVAKAEAELAMQEEYPDVA